MDIEDSISDISHEIHLTFGLTQKQFTVKLGATFLLSIDGKV